MNGKDAATLKHSDLVRHVSVAIEDVCLVADTLIKRQDREITGLITDSTGRPLAGVTVAVAGRSNIGT